MAIWGLSKPVMGTYTASGSTVTYSNGFVANKAVEYSTSIDAANDNPFYADNMVCENDKGTFAGGTITLKTASIPQAMSKKILGTSTYTQSYTVASASKTATVQVYDDNQSAPYLGFGIVEAHSESDVKKYRAVFLNKVWFKIPDNAATTKGDTIDWQTPELSGTILRSDEVRTEQVQSVSTVVANHPWMEDAWFDSEADAYDWLAVKVGGITA